MRLTNYMRLINHKDFDINILLKLQSKIVLVNRNHKYSKQEE